MSISDVLIIGGGPAGLSVATGLARQMHRAVVFDSGFYRNAPTSFMHNIAGWDHTPPAEFRQAARERILSRYDTIQFENTVIQKVERIDGGLFEATDTQDRAWTGKKPVLASGVHDIFPDIPGYGEGWGKGIFHCLFCHGYEERGQESVGVLAVEDLAVPGPAMHVARMARRFATTVTVYTHGVAGITEELEKAAQGTGIKVDSRPIARLAKGPGESDVEITFDDGTRQMEGFLTHRPKTQINGPFAGQLGLELVPSGDIKTEEFFSTSIPGVFAAGDCASALKAVVLAMSSGTTVAGGLASQLQAEL